MLGCVDLNVHLQVGLAPWGRNSGRGLRGSGPHRRPSTTKAPLSRGFLVEGYFLALPYKPLLRLTPGRFTVAPWRPAVMPFR